MCINIKKTAFIYSINTYAQHGQDHSSLSSDIRVKINDGVPMTGMRTFQRRLEGIFDRRFRATNNENIRRNHSFSRSTEETLLVALTWV
ncbi:hypothetical protein CEXT_279491 [Caerostris extrusa]|uniref:Uncharacterized protein n=1 Tax=Caerostris extrusa TaxID=172846 RepID=A0AAV4R1P3_CAEEX|nr:hypothetical protein CEXT_279491 [Caerostris extrusa]